MSSKVKIYLNQQSFGGDGNVTINSSQSRIILSIDLCPGNRETRKKPKSAGSKKATILTNKDRSQ